MKDYIKKVLSWLRKKHWYRVITEKGVYGMLEDKGVSKAKRYILCVFLVIFVLLVYWFIIWCFVAISEGLMGLIIVTDPNHVFFNESLVYSIFIASFLLWQLRTSSPHKALRFFIETQLFLIVCIACLIGYDYFILFKETGYFGGGMAKFEEIINSHIPHFIVCGIVSAISCVGIIYSFILVIADMNKSQKDAIEKIKSVETKVSNLNKSINSKLNKLIEKEKSDS